MIRIATAQSRITGNPIENATEIHGLMSQAHDAGADLIHFPEGAISGYAKSPIKSWADVDWAALREQLELTALHAAGTKLWVVVGGNHQLSAPNRPHNSMYVIAPDGTLHTRYDKQYCSNTEIEDWYSPGRSNVVFDVKGFRFGCSLCIEIQFPELFLSYENQGIDCMLFSSFSDSEMFRIQAQAHAAANNYWFSYSVPTQQSEKVASTMIGPDGSIVGSCQRDQSGIFVSELDREAAQWEIPIKRARPWRAKAREGAIYRTSYVEDPRSEEKKEF